MKPADIKEQFLKAHELYADAIFRHCYFKISDREQAFDITQEAFMRTWEFMADGGTITNIRAFLYRITNNIIIDTYRKKKSSSLDELADQGFDVGFDEASRLADRFDGALALKILETLSEKYRTVIIMRYIDDLSPSEIARALGTTENTVSVRIHRGLKQLRDLHKKND